MKNAGGNTYGGRNQNGQRGFSLVEVLITLAVMAISLLALSKFQVNILGEGTQAKARSEALNLAHTRLESLRAFSNTAAFNALGGGSDSVQGATASFSRTWTVTPASGNPDVKLARVQVTWPDKNGSVTGNTTLTLNSAISSATPGDSARVALNLARAEPPSAPGNENSETE